MKVVVCTPYKGVNPNNPGGIAIWARNINAFYELHKKDMNLDICAIDREHDFENEFSFARIWYGVKEYWENYRKVKNFVKGKQYDVMHICTSASLSLLKDLLFLNVAKQNSIKTTIHFHFGRIPEIFTAKNWEYKLICQVIRKANTVAVMDKKSYETLVKAGYSNVIYLPNPLSTTVCDAIEKESKIVTSRKDGEVLFAGHVIPSKGVYELVEACAKVEQVKKLTLLGIVEDKRVQDDLISKANSIRGNHDWVEFAGAVPHERVIKEMLQCSLFVLPTYTEGFPNVILESMACACPIITTSVGAIPEMLQFKSMRPCGCCVEVNDVVGLQSRIDAYLSDTNSAKQMGKSAKERVYSTYSMSSVWRELSDIWVSTQRCL